MTYQKAAQQQARARGQHCLALEALGPKLRHAREELELSQYHLAEQLAGIGVSVQQNTVGRWERGENIPSLDTFGRLCRFFKLSADELLRLDQ